MRWHHFQLLFGKSQVELREGKGKMYPLGFTRGPCMPHRLKENVGVQLDVKAAGIFVPRKGRKKRPVGVCNKEGEGKATQEE